ncbi:hypothetical protein L1887_54905 [Cichorium endivia]|nr:hypothetical protein L1887_54905 [Cichorium endivia]
MMLTSRREKILRVNAPKKGKGSRRADFTSARLPKSSTAQRAASPDGVATALQAPMTAPADFLRRRSQPGHLTAQPLQRLPVKVRVYAARWQPWHAV